MFPCQELFWGNIKSRTMKNFPTLKSSMPEGLSSCPVYFISVHLQNGDLFIWRVIYKTIGMTESLGALEHLEQEQDQSLRSAVICNITTLEQLHSWSTTVLVLDVK